MTGTISKQANETEDDGATVVQSSPCIPSSRLTVVVMCFIMVLCNFSMRANLGVAIVCMNSDPFETFDNASYNGTNVTTGGNAQNVTSAFVSPQVKEFQWSRQLRGLILAAFFVGYIPLQIPAGWLANRYGGKWPLFGGMAVLALSTFLSPVSARVSPYMLLVIQIVKGAAGATFVPSLYQLLGRWSPPPERSRIVGCVNSASGIGVLISNALSGWLCEHGFAGGWPSIFYVYAIFTSGCLVLLVFLAYDGPGNHPRISWRERRYIEAGTGHLEQACSVPWRAILRSVPLYAILFANLSSGWLSYTAMTTLPQYIQDVLKFSITKNGIVTATAYLLKSVMQWPAGWLADYLINARVLSVTNVRKMFMTIGLLAPAFLLLCMSFLDHRHPILAVACLLGTFAIVGCCILGHDGNMLDLAPRYLGVIKSVANMGPNFSGLIAPVVAGALTTNGSRQEWQHVYIVTAVICVLGTLQYLIFASAEEQPWARPPKPEDDIEVRTINQNCPD